jgi:hypothetical protein
MWKELLKSDLRKADYKIVWEKIYVDYVKIKNKPKEWVNMYSEEGYDDFDTVEVEAGDATVEGYFYVDVRTWGVKELSSSANEISFVLSLEDSESDIYEDLDIVITEIENGEDDIKINPSDIEVTIDMKGQTDPSKFETKAIVNWQGVY